MEKLMPKISLFSYLILASFISMPLLAQDYKWATSEPTKVTTPISTDYLVPDELYTYFYNKSLVYADFQKELKKALSDPDAYAAETVAILYGGTELTVAKRLSYTLTLQSLCETKSISKDKVVKLVTDIVPKLNEAYADAKAIKDGNWLDSTINFFFNIYDKQAPNKIPSLITILGSIGENYGADIVGDDGITALKAIGSDDPIGPFFPDVMAALVSITGTRSSSALEAILYASASPKQNCRNDLCVVPDLSKNIKARASDRSLEAVVLALVGRGDKKIVKDFYSSGLGTKTARNTAASYLGKELPYPYEKYFRVTGDIATVTSNVIFLLMTGASAGELTIAEDAPYTSAIMNDINTETKVVELYPKATDGSNVLTGTDAYSTASVSSNTLRIGDFTRKSSSIVKELDQGVYMGNTVLKLQPDYEIVNVPQLWRVEKVDNLANDMNLAKNIFTLSKVVLVADQFGAWALNPQTSTVVGVSATPGSKKTANLKKVYLVAKWADGRESKFMTWVGKDKAGDGQLKEIVAQAKKNSSGLPNVPKTVEIKTDYNEDGDVLIEIPEKLPVEVPYTITPDEEEEEEEIEIDEPGWSQVENSAKLTATEKIEWMHPEKIIENDKNKESVTVTVTQADGNVLTYTVKVDKNADGEKQLEDIVTGLKPLGEVKVNSTVYDDKGKLISKQSNPYDIKNSTEDSGNDQGDIDKVKDVESLIEKFIAAIPEADRLVYKLSKVEKLDLGISLTIFLNEQTDVLSLQNEGLKYVLQNMHPTRIMKAATNALVLTGTDYTAYNGAALINTTGKSPLNKLAKYLNANYGVKLVCDPKALMIKYFENVAKGSTIKTPLSSFYKDGKVYLGRDLFYNIEAIPLRFVYGQ
jgi:hypothetical protein